MVQPLAAINVNQADAITTDGQTDIVKPWEIFLMVWLLLISGNPYITRNLDTAIVISTIIPAWYVYKNSNRPITYRTIVIFVFFIGYELMHAVMFSLDYSLTIFKIFLVLLFAFCAVQLLRERFVIILTRTMVILSLISFVFTLLCYVPGLNRTLYNLASQVFYIDQGYKAYVNPTLLIYTFSHEYFTGEFSYARNPGPFWESGAFAAFLLVTLFLHYSIRRISSIEHLFDRQATVLVIAIVSTTSTTGFFALMVLLFYYTAQTKSAIKYVLVVLMGLSFYVAFVNVEFLGSKVAKEIEESSTRNNRFGAALMDWEDIKKRPLLGSSRRIEVLFGTTEASLDTRRPNGFTNFLRNYGFVYPSIYFILVFISFYAVMTYHGNFGKRNLAFFGIILLWIVSFSELVFNLAFFKALIFLSQTYGPNNHASKLPSTEPTLPS
jgi:hypothetical protein